MADTKISALPTATALDGTELIPVVQGGETRQNTVNNLGLARLSTDINGNTVLAGPDGNIPFAGPYGFAYEEDDIQELLDLGTPVVLASDITITRSISIGTGSKLNLNGFELLLGGGTKRQMVTTSNAIWAAGAQPMGGVQIVCADEGITGGTITRVPGSPAKLQWQATGDTAGTAVDVSGADTKYVLPSGTAGKALYVMVYRTQLNHTDTRTVIVNGTTGAKPMAWSRASNVLTVTEAGHNRQADDAIQLLGAGITTTAFIDYVVDANTYVITPDTRSNASGTGTVFGVRRFAITNGTFNGDYLTNVGAADWRSFGIFINAASSYDLHHLVVNDIPLHAIHMTNISKYKISHIHADFTAYDLVHVNGPSLGGDLEIVSGSTLDNMVGMGTTDYPQILTNSPLDAYNNGHVVVGNVRGLYPVDAWEAFRAYGCADWYIGWGKVDGIYGSSNTNQGFSIKGDTATIGSSVEQNCCDLEFKNVHMRPASTATVDFRLMTIDMTGDVRGITIDGFDLTHVPTGAAGVVKITGTVKDLTLKNPIWQDARTAAGALRGWSGGAVVELTNAGTIDTLKLEDWNRIPTENTENTNPYLVYVVNNANTINHLLLERVNPEHLSATGNRLRMVRNNGTIRRLTFKDCDTKGAEWLGHSTAGCATTQLEIINCNGYKGANTGNLYLCNFDQRMPERINLDGVDGDATQLLRQYTTTVSACRITARAVNPSMVALLKGASGPTYSVFSSDVPFTLSDLDRSVPGQTCIAKTALGTIPINTLAVNDGTGAANSWKAVHNTTLVY